MTIRDKFWNMFMNSQKNRDSIGRVGGWMEQFDELDKRYTKLVEKKNKLEADLATANNKISELEMQIAKLTKPKRKYHKKKVNE